MSEEFEVSLNYEKYLVYLEYESEDKTFKHKMALQPTQAIALGERLQRHGIALQNKL